MLSLQAPSIVAALSTHLPVTWAAATSLAAVGAALPPPPPACTHRGPALLRSHDPVQARTAPLQRWMATGTVAGRRLPVPEVDVLPPYASNVRFRGRLLCRTRHACFHSSSVCRSIGASVRMRQLSPAAAHLPPPAPVCRHCSSRSPSGSACRRPRRRRCKAAARSVWPNSTKRCGGQAGLLCNDTLGCVDSLCLGRGLMTWCGGTMHAVADQWHTLVCCAPRTPPVVPTHAGQADCARAAAGAAGMLRA